MDSPLEVPQEAVDLQRMVEAGRRLAKQSAIRFETLSSSWEHLYSQLTAPERQSADRLARSTVWRLVLRGAVAHLQELLTPPTAG